MAEKEKTPEQLREEAKANAKKTLESKFYQGVYGSNFGKSNPTLVGEWYKPGVETAYAQITSGEEFNKSRMDGHNEKAQQMNSVGVYGEPAIPSNADVSYSITTQLRESQDITTLGELEAICKKMGAKLDFSVPKELAGITHREVIKKAIESKALDPKTGQLDASKLSQKELDVLNIYKTLTDIYTKASVYSVANPYMDLNQQGSTIAEKYNPKKTEAK